MYCTSNALAQCSLEKILIAGLWFSGTNMTDRKMISSNTARSWLSNKTVEPGRYHLVRRGFLVAVVNPVSSWSGADIPLRGSLRRPHAEGWTATGPLRSHTPHAGNKPESKTWSARVRNMHVLIAMHIFRDLCQWSAGTPWTTAYGQKCVCANEVELNKNKCISKKGMEECPYLDQELGDLVVSVWAGVVQGDQVSGTQHTHTQRTQQLVIPTYPHGNQA